MNENSIAIVCSHPLESRAVASILKNAKKQKFSLFRGYTGEFENFHCSIIESGMGSNLAYIATKQLEPIFHPGLIIDFGAVAGVNPELAAGEIIIAERIIDLSEFINEWKKTDPFFQSPPPDTKTEELKTDLKILKNIEKVEKIIKGVIGSADHFLDNSRIRKKIAGMEIDAFDYESFAVIKSASEMVIPGISLRVISDNGDEKAGADFKKNIKKVLPGAANCLRRIIKQISLSD
jgi:nucleoside phosphorylase